jgi:hypothetical protein
MSKDKRDVVILSLICIVVLLFLCLAYILLINPAIKAKATQQYNQGQVDFVNSMLLQIQQTGAVRIPLNDNQMLMLIPYNPNQ